MRRALALAGLGLALVSAVAYAAVDKKQLHHLFAGGLTVGNTGTAMDDSYAGSATIDFPSATDVCDDSSTITVTGAAQGDGCIVGTPASMPTESWFTCLVTAANTVVVRHCSHGAGNPASGTFTVRVFDM